MRSVCQFGRNIVKVVVFFQKFIQSIQFVQGVVFYNDGYFVDFCFVFFDSFFFGCYVSYSVVIVNGLLKEKDMDILLLYFGF